MKRPAVFVLLAIYFFSGCATSKNTPPFSQTPSIANEEVAIGEKIHAQILSSFYAYTDPKVVEYINKVGQSLAARAERKDLPYRFTILYNEKIYATSAPGGFIYLTTGLLYFIENEAELAAVLSHELGELQYKDPRLSRSRKILEAVTKGGAMVGPAFGEFGMLAALGLVALSAASKQKKISPEQRIIYADQRAMHYMVDAGYDPQGMIDLLYKFLNAEKQVAPYFYDYYQSRPISQPRFQALQREFSVLPLQGKTLSTNQKQYQEMTHGVRQMYEHT